MIAKLRVATKPLTLLAAHLVVEGIRIVDQRQQENYVPSLGVGLIVNLDSPYLDQQ